MKYYRLENEYRKEIVGPYPQSEGMADDYNYQKENSVWNIYYDNPIVPDLDAIKLTKGANLTDMLSVVSISRMAGKIVSEKFRDLTLEFSLPQHQFYEAKVVDYKNSLITEKKYFLFRLLEYQNRCINFDRSEFFIYQRGVGEIDSITIYGVEDLEKSPGDDGLGVGEFIKPRFISLELEKTFDIFSFRHIAGFFVSERLKNAIESVGLTGMRFEELEFPILQEKLDN